jgi:GT2 family glycosyltransferase
VSVIVPVRNGAASVRRCLDALAQQQGASYEVIVVDNDSRDGTAQLVAAHPLAPRVVHESRRGSYAARNAGIAVARADVLAFTDIDCIPKPDWLSQGLSALRTTQADVVGGQIQPSASPNPTKWERYDRAIYLRQDELVEHAGMAATANVFVRRAVLEALGGFDPSLQSSGDLEFCLRARRAGYRLAYAAGPVVAHQPRQTMRETWRLHRRLGAGWAALHRRGELQPWWRAPEHRLSLSWTTILVAREGPRLRRRQLLPIHAVAMTGRLYGRLIGSLSSWKVWDRT